MQGRNGTANGLVTEEHDDQQTNKNGEPHAIEQTLVATEHIIFRTDDSHAPIGLADRTVEHQGIVAVDHELLHAALACNHLSTQRVNSSPGFGVGIGENGLVDEFQSIGMHQILAFTTNNDTRRIRIGRHRSNLLREPLQIQIDGDNANEIAVAVEEWTTIGGDDIRVVVSLGIGVQIRIYPATLTKPLGFRIPVKLEILEIIAAVLGSADGVGIAHRINGEIAAKTWEIVRFH